MYTKQEAAQLRQQFWTSFGQYLAPVPSAGGEKVNWINYKTGVKPIHFRMNADERSAYIGIEISHASDEQRKIFFDHFVSLKKYFLHDLKGKWVWESDFHVHGKSISRVYSVLQNVNIYRKEDWPAMITFFKSAITGIDRFWAEYREMFEMLQ